MTKPPYKIYKKVHSTKYGDVNEILIGTEYEHPQLKAPAPVITMCTSVVGDGTLLKTIHISEDDAEFIVRSCNSHSILVDALKEFVANVEHRLETDIPADAETSKQIFENAKKAIAAATL